MPDYPSLILTGKPISSSYLNLLEHTAGTKLVKADGNLFQDFAGYLTTSSIANSASYALKSSVADNAYNADNAFGMNSAGNEAVISGRQLGIWSDTFYTTCLSGINMATTDGTYTVDGESNVTYTDAADIILTGGNVVGEASPTGGKITVGGEKAGTTSKAGSVKIEGGSIGSGAYTILPGDVNIYAGNAGDSTPDGNVNISTRGNFGASVSINSGVGPANLSGVAVNLTAGDGDFNIATNGAGRTFINSSGRINLYSSTEEINLDASGGDVNVGYGSEANFNVNQKASFGAAEVRGTISGYGSLNTSVLDIWGTAKCRHGLQLPYSSSAHPMDALNVTTGSMYFKQSGSVSLLYVYTGTQWKSASLA